MRVSLCRIWLLPIVAAGCSVFGTSASSPEPSPEDASAPAPDASAPDVSPRPDAADPADATVPGPKRAFVTAQGYVMPQGNMAALDVHCTKEASAAGLGGAWLAWISDDTVDARARFLAAGMNGPWVGLGPAPAAQIAANLDVLTGGQLEAPINFGPRGTALDVFVWTGTLSGGMRSGSCCKSWSSTSSADSATVGSSGSKGAKWVNNLVPEPCAATEAHLYCFEK